MLTKRSDGGGSLRVAVLVAVLGAIALFGGAAQTAFAQFGPPMSVFGSISDSAGAVAEGAAVEAYVGNTLCGKGRTQFTGDGDGRVTVYFVNVVAREQTPNCGSSGIEVRVKVGDRFAPGSIKWEAGPQRFDVTFGTATAAPIPTFTPTPRPAGQTPPSTPAPGTPTPTGAAATPGSGTASPSAAASGAASPTSFPSATATATLRGGIGSGGSSGGSGSSGGGFPVWAAVLAGLGGVAVVGGVVGFLMARNRPEADDPEAFRPPKAPTE